METHTEIAPPAIHRQILDSLSTSVFLLDADFAIAYMNESAEILIQTSLNRAQGLPLGHFINEGLDFPAGSNIISACNKSIDQNLRVWLRDVEISLPSVLQEKHVDCRIFPLDTDSGIRPVLEILPQSSEHARQIGSDETNTTHTVIRGLAHEIRNPLGGMRGAAQLLAGELPEFLPDEHQIREFTQYTDIIIREADRLSNLVGRMQASSVINDMGPVNIHSVIEQVRQLMETDGFAGAVLSTDYDPSLPEVMGDPGQLTQAFINILKNAIEAAGSVDAELSIVIKTRIDHQVLPGSDQQRQVVRVDVSDDGAGIDKSLLDHIFEPMVSGKSEGIGLGLSITSEIIRNHNGLMTVQSEPGHTVFSTYLKTSGMDAKI